MLLQATDYDQRETERRRSGRWRCEKTIDWRVHGGRRLRHGFVSERSLDGMVITASEKDAAPAGTLIYAADHDTSVRHGFGIGVICRTKKEADGQCWLFIDILN